MSEQTVPQPIRHLQESVQTDVVKDRQIIAKGERSGEEEEEQACLSKLCRNQ